MQSQSEKTILTKVIGALTAIALVFTMATVFVAVSTPSSMAGESQDAVVSTEGGITVGEVSEVDTKSLEKGGELLIEDDETPMASAADLAAGSETDSLLRGLGISVAAVLILLAAGGTSMLLTMRSRKRQ